MLAEITYNQPVLSAFLLLIAGILVGYALSYSLRGSGEAIKSQLHDLAEQNRELSAGLASIEELKTEAWGQLTEERVEKVALATELQTTQVQLAEAQKETAILNRKLTLVLERLEETEDEKQQALGKWQIEHDQRLALDNMLRHKENMLRQGADQAAELAASRDRVEDLQARLAERETQLNRVASQQDPATGELEATQTGARGPQIDQLRQLLEETTNRLRRVTAERDDAIEQQRDSEQRLAAAIEDIESHRRAIDVIERQRIEFRSSVEQEQSQVAGLKNAMEAAHQKIQTLDVTIEELGTRLRVTELERSEARTLLTKQTGEMEQIQADLSKYRQQCDQLRRQREEMLSQLRTEQARAQQLEAELPERQAQQMAELQDARQALEQIKPTLAEMQIQLAQREERMAAVAEQHREEVADLRKQLAAQAQQRASDPTATDEAYPARKSA